MLKRTITGAALVLVLIAVLLFLPVVFTPILLSAMVAIAAYELLWSTKLVENGRLVCYGAITAVAVVWWSYCGMVYAWALAGVLIFTGACICELLISHGKLPFQQVALAAIAGFLVPYLLSALVRIVLMAHGRYLILAPFVMAFMTDTGAYLVGCSMGRHKLCPIISPKKTVEGLVGGILGGIVGMILYALVLSKAWHFQVNYLSAAIYGAAGAGTATLGDLLFSVIKRQSGIKDYGKLLPGHGGILDRFDSVTLVAPVAEVLFLILPLAVK